MSVRELDDRQEMLHRINTHRTRPMDIEPSRVKRKTRWQRFVIRIKALFLRRG
jgi:hypothetical protein